DTAFDHCLDGRLAIENRSSIDELGPAVGHVVCEKQVQSLEHADQRGGAGQLVLAQRTVPFAALHPVPAAFGYAEECSPFRIAAAPGIYQPENRLHSGAGQSPTITLAGKCLQNGMSR